MYINRGDVNFFDGGRLVEDEGDGVYSIIMCDAFYDEEDSYLFAHVEIDINDSWIDIDAVERFGGVPEDEITLALDILSYYGPQEFGDGGEALNHDEIVSRMDNWCGEFESEPWHYLD